MDKFHVHEGLVVPLDRVNIDTDAIIPKQFLTSIKRSGFGPNLFDEWRYMDRGEPGLDCSQRPVNPAFELNFPAYAGATILLTRANFGCGSSREHAVWALQEFGFRVILAPSFGDIFFANSLKNGLLVIVLPSLVIDRLFAAARDASLRLAVDLAAQTIDGPSLRQPLEFDIDPFRKRCLLEGLDEVGLTLTQANAVSAFERRHHEAFPWLGASV